MGYDHIVIGAGAAGCAVAARLSEDADRRVLLVEAGGHNRRLSVKAPAAFAAQFGTKLDWRYVTEPEEHLDGRRLEHPRGRLMGGCSSMNAMMYVRGSRYDFDQWAAGGATGWSAEEVLPYFVRAEDHADLRDRYHGQGGPIHVQAARDPDPVTLRIIEACEQAGITRRDELNGEHHDGVALTQVNVRRGVRQDTATAYLRDARRRPNLDVLTGALVHRVLLRDGRAVAVELSTRRGGIRRVEAGADVVLSAGAFGTPEILQRSGIGPADHLRSVGIDATVDLPAVGRHLMDHPFQFLNVELRESSPGLFGIEHPRNIARWLGSRRGPLASNIGEAMGFFRTDDALPAADMELVIAPIFFWEHGKGKHVRPAFSIGLSYVAPESRGSVLVRSADPTVKGRVHLNMLSHESEVDAIVRGLRRAREIVAQPALADVRGPEINPGPGVHDDHGLREYIRATVQHTYHPACSARIGSPEDGACDPLLRVHGVDGLRIADASVMPTVTRGNTHAPTIMIGERCADLIRTGGVPARPTGTGVGAAEVAPMP
ncbi:MAG: GMC family oxidoreductase N-terminal domain-containing protein [Solirubrobacteraceae bacterium]|nr:GMC family oxidoreductase N-terminal domain-containing protein [Solirubrobacteraceae bacterium]